MGFFKKVESITLLPTTSENDFQQRIMVNLWEREGRQKETEGEEINRSSPFFLFFNDCFHWANLHTASTFRAFLFVDHIGFAFFNGFGRTFLSTRSAGNALVGNNIGHSDHLLCP
jgi:hypothetical protein